MRRPVVTMAAGVSRVRFHQLSLRTEGDEHIVGRVDTGDFIAVPEVAALAIDLLSAGLTISETRQRLIDERGRDIDVRSFVDDLVEVGFVAALDDEDLAAPMVKRESLPWLRQRHVRWLLTWPVAVAVGAVIAAGLTALAIVPQATPGYRDLLWTRYGSLVLLSEVVITWSIIGAHELAHLATARAAGVPGRVGLGTRLQFLAVQTDVSGVWSQPRAVRLAVYLSGMLLNLVLAALAIIARAAIGPHSGAGRAFGIVALLSLLTIPPQFLVFMRTDVYFVLQDLTRSRSLFADGAAYARWRLRRRAGADPSRDLPRHERRAVRVYAVVLAVGAATSLAVFAVVTVPLLMSILFRAAGHLVRGGPAARLDGLAAIGAVGGYWVLWCRVWWRRRAREGR